MEHQKLEIYVYCHLLLPRVAKKKTNFHSNERQHHHRGLDDKDGR